MPPLNTNQSVSEFRNFSHLGRMLFYTCAMYAFAFLYLSQMVPSWVNFYIAQLLFVGVSLLVAWKLVASYKSRIFDILFLVVLLVSLLNIYTLLSPF